MMPMYMRPQGGCCYQGFGNYPHHVMKMDAASSPVQCEHWPTLCCGHGNVPYWPPTPCYPPQAPYHTWFHPHAPPPPCYVHHPFPPVGYQHGFESEKEKRCTKCSPQMSYPKNGTGVVIEEHETENEKGGKGGGVDHVRSTGCPYPIIWLPHENAKGQEHGSHAKPPAQIKAPESRKDPKSWNGSFPLDENTLKSLIQNQDRSKLQNGKTVELPFDISKLKSLLQSQGGQTQPGQLQYPIFWIPSQGRKEDAEAPEKKESGNEGSDLKSVSSDHLINGRNFEGNAVSDAEEKSLVRNIPVETYKEPRSIPVKQLQNHLPEPTKKIVKTEAAEDTRKEQRSSPAKASRLPPVCLRVDPLPKSKSGKSKSLSPPRRKEQTLTSEESKVASPMSSKMVETRTTPEYTNVNEEKKTSEGWPMPTGTEKESVPTKSDLQGVKCEIVKPCEAKEPAKKTFTEDEAARVIQSTYRGYDVRRWEPIKKLKEIASVREEMSDVKRRVQALELSADQHSDGNEIVVLGEMVMGLLLKLDSVQGLHPSIRDYRKSLARELSDMQENIDSLKKSSVEKEAEKEQVDTTTQTSECPVSLEQSQLAEENNMASDSNTEKVCLPPPENTIDGQLVSEAEAVTELSETLAVDPEPSSEKGVCEADSTTIPEKTEAPEAMLPINASSADGDEMTVTNEEDEVMVKKCEEPLPELQEEVENAAEVSETVANASESKDRKGDGEEVLPSEKIEAVETVLSINQSSADGNEMRMTNVDEDQVMVEKIEEPQAVETEVSETVANVSETEDRKGDDDSVLASENDVELLELLVGVIDDKMQLRSQDSLSSLVVPGMASNEINVDHSGDHFNGIGQETQVSEVGMSEETKKLMEENQRFKETMKTLVEAGREQLEVISKLTGRVKSLEKKLSQKKRTHIGRRKVNRGKQTTKPMSASCTDALM